jgi:hypothetical protein
MGAITASRPLSNEVVPRGGCNNVWSGSLLGLAWLNRRTLGVVTGIGLGYARSLTVYGHDTTTYTFTYVSYVTSILCVFAGWDEHGGQC